MSEGALIPLHGRAIPAKHYEDIRRLEKVAFGLTPSDWPDTMAHHAAIEAAIEGHEAMRLCIRRKVLAKLNR